MNNIILKIRSFLVSQSKNAVTIKLSIVSVAFFLGCLWQPLFLLTFALTALFMVCESGVNSIFYLLFLMPLISLFSFNNKFGLNYWFLLVCVFVLVHGIKTIIRVVKKQEKLNLPLTIILGVCAIYLSIPFSGNFNIVSVGESYVWLALFYLVFSHIKNIKLQPLTIIACAGYLYSSFVGLFVKVIPYLANNIIIFKSAGLVRFSGALFNPNTFYSWGMVCLSLLLVLIWNKKLSLWYFALALPILFFCYLSLSKTFMIIYIILMIVMFFAMFIKRDKHKIKVAGLTLIITILTAGVLFNYSKAYYERFFNSAPIPMDTVVQQVPSVGKPSTGGESGPSEDVKKAENVVNTVTTGRLDLWKLYFNNIKEHDAFLFGFGINTAQGLTESNSHNTYLQVLYEVGACGVVMIIGIMVYYLKKSKFKAFKNLGSICYLPAIALACNFMTENLFLSQMGNMFLILACLGLMVIEGDHIENKNTKEVICHSQDKAESKDFALAIITPAYNRPELLSQAYNSLKNQTAKDFVWYVIDDGSQAPQEPEVKKFMQENKIRIKFIKKENGGKHTALNVGIKEVNEPAVLILDNDDYLKDNAVELIKADWSLIENRRDICGLGYLKVHQDGKIVGVPYSIDGVVDTFVNERYNNATIGDKAEVFKTSVLKQFPFPEFENEKFLSESSVWCKMSGEYKFLFFNQPIYVCEYLDGGLSGGVQKRLFQNPKGATYCYNQLTTRQFNFTNKVKYTLLYIVHSMACGTRIKGIIKNSFNKCLTLLLMPFGWGLFVYRKKKYQK